MSSNIHPKLIKQTVPSVNPIWNKILHGLNCPCCVGAGRKKVYPTIYRLNYHIAYHHNESCEGRKKIIEALLLLVSKGVLK